MNVKVLKRILERSQGLCEICGSNNQVELHHIVYGNGKRKEHENEHSCIMLCFQHHKGNEGVHGMNGHRLNMMLKKDLQQRYMDMGYTEEEIRSLMGGMLYG